MKDLLIRGARIVNPAKGEDYYGDIAVENGKITAMGCLGSLPGGRQIFSTEKYGEVWKNRLLAPDA